MVVRGGSTVALFYLILFVGDARRVVGHCNSSTTEINELRVKWDGNCLLQI